MASPLPKSGTRRRRRCCSPRRALAALRGPVPLTAAPHNAIGSTPGVGIIQIAEGGRTGALVSVVPVTNPTQQEKQQPDPHGLRVRLVR